MQKKRIEWIDLAKGFCMMLVVIAIATVMIASGYYEGWGDTTHYQNVYFIPWWAMYALGIAGSIMIFELAYDGKDCRHLIYRSLQHRCPDNPS